MIRWRRAGGASSMKTRSTLPEGLRSERADINAAINFLRGPASVSVVRTARSRSLPARAFPRAREPKRRAAWMEG